MIADLLSLLALARVDPLQKDPHEFSAMQFLALLVACAAVSPIEKTIELLESLQAKIVKEGEAEAKLYEEFTSFCNDESKETQFEIKTGKGASERASATIADETAKIGAAEAKIDELSTTIATNEKDLGAATEIREKAPAISPQKNLGYRLLQ